jgi:hypothetical protein
MHPSIPFITRKHSPKPYVRSVISSGIIFYMLILHSIVRIMSYLNYNPNFACHLRFKSFFKVNCQKSFQREDISACACNLCLHLMCMSHHAYLLKLTTHRSVISLMLVDCIYASKTTDQMKVFIWFKLFALLYCQCECHVI